MKTRALSGRGCATRRCLRWYVLPCIVLITQTMTALRRLKRNREDNADELSLEEDLSLYRLMILTSNDFEYGRLGCPQWCGCAETPRDCLRQYSVCDIVRSAANTNARVEKYWTRQLEERYRTERNRCHSTPTLFGTTGGWCLVGRRLGEKIAIPESSNGKAITFDLTIEQEVASKQIGATIESLIRKERIQSISDFGAGIGQYGAYLLQKFHKNPPGFKFTYRGYDGAGDLEDHTRGFLSYVDLTIPLYLPVSDWVISFEVGQYIPSKYEGVLIRNLHRHNRKGVILSWGILGQHGRDVLGHKGHDPINNHANEYIAGIFEELGYTRDRKLEALLRDPTNNQEWFVGSAMAFRRDAQSFAGKTCNTSIDF